MIPEPSIINKNHINISGNPNANQTILFSHGFGTDQTCWHPLMSAFDSDYKLVMYDMVGAGKSDPEAFSPERYDSLVSYADDLIDICSELDLENITLIGHSVSGMVGLIAAEKKPSLFSNLVLIGASPRYINDDHYTGGFTQEALNALYEQMETNYDAWVGGFAPYVMQNEDRPELAGYFAKTLSEVRPDIAVSFVRTIFQSDYRHLLHEVKLPVLLVHAEHDPAVPVFVADFLNKHIPDSRLRILNISGHFPHISHPGEVIAAIQSFL